jgi:tetratricopeptide (TPR) repeat protein
VILTGKGQFEEADAELRKAQILDPLSPMITEGVAENFYSWRRYDDVIEQVERVRRMGSSIADDTLGLAYIQKGMYQEAIGLFSARVQADRTRLSLTNLAITYAAAG